jgi:hypothetical protein
MNAIKVIGFETFDYTESKLKADITTYWKELYWKNNSYLTRYIEVYENTI